METSEANQYPFLDGTDNAYLIRTFQTEVNKHTIEVYELIDYGRLRGPYGWECQDCHGENEGFGSSLIAEDDADQWHFEKDADPEGWS